MKSRQQLLTRLRAGDGLEDLVLIVGAGANGLGLYRDLALQGVPALVIDKGDFASGTSAAPSRLIHGGLRYLEIGEFELVRESVIERNHLLVNAPHLVHPLRVWVPASSWLGGAFASLFRFLGLKKTPGAKGLAVVKLGLMFFDRFGRKNRIMPDHRLVGSSEVRRRLPGLASSVVGVAEYYDAKVTHPERLALELAGDAERDCESSMAFSYLSLEALRGGTAILHDEIDGQRYAIRPKLVVNCAGPWVDDVNGRLGISQRLCGGTKGSHLVFLRPDLVAQLQGGMLYFETHDHRACLIYAMDERHVLVGTTDLRTESPEDVRCSDAEIDYLFDVLTQVLPSADLRREEIVFTYAGVRPLPSNNGGATGAISRDHKLHHFSPTQDRDIPVLTLVGGKWTTYRACAAQIADAVLSEIGAPRRRSTLFEQIGGGRGFPRDIAAQDALAASLARDNGLDPAATRRLLARYGSKAGEVAVSVVAHGRVLLTSAPEYFVGEIAWIAINERVARLADVILRRTLLAFEGCTGRAVLEEVADILVPLLDWQGTKRDDEVEGTEALLRQRYRVDLAAGVDEGTYRGSR